MPRDLTAFRNCQVFLNYPYDHEFEQLGLALNFAVVAAGLLPVAARDFASPDVPRLTAIVDAIQQSTYSAHDLSRYTGGGRANYARMNMPLEMGMGIFYALQHQLREHRCAFFVPTPHDYQHFASDLAGLDPQCHNGEPPRLVAQEYDWLRSVVPRGLFNDVPTVEVVEAFERFIEGLAGVRGTGDDGMPSHIEAREVMYQLCAERGWWDWRATRLGREQFPEVPLARKPEQARLA